MQFSRISLFAAAAFALPAFVRDSDPCEDIAGAMQRADEHDAQADYWRALANCRNCDHCDDAACVRVAKSELRDALALAQEKKKARHAVCDALGGGVYDPQLDPTTFSSTIDNRYLPWVPGVTMVYEGPTPDGFEHVEVTPLDEVDTVGGFSARAVHDVVLADGRLIEDTRDWYAQSPTGDVWYIGEVSLSYGEDGFLDDIDGSWRTGKDGAKPGIAMLGVPTVGAFYRQEFLSGVAEDVAKVLALDETVTVPFGTFAHCIETQEAAALEPDGVEFKFYAPGVGLVLVVDGGTGERLELIEVR